MVLFAGILLLACGISFGAGTPEIPRFWVKTSGELGVGKENFDLRSNPDLDKLKGRIEKLHETLEAERDARKRRHRQLNENHCFSELPYSKLRELHTAGVNLSKDCGGLEEILRLIDLARAESGRTREKIEKQILEMALGIANNHRRITPGYVGLETVLFVLPDALRNPMAKGNRPAQNLAPGAAIDLSLVDPIPSPYWKRPLDVRSADLFTGFDRTKAVDFTNLTWRYKGPKLAGWNPGFELTAGDLRMRVKFAETHSEPFNSRIFHALGYDVDATDYVPWLKIKYDRRLLREINMRAAMKMKVGVLFVPLYQFNFQREYDPFDYIDHAILDIGRIVPGSELKRLLLRKGANPRQLEPENFNIGFERSIEYLVTKSANVQYHESQQSVGRWDFGGLGREHMRELRGAGVLAAWVGWWDPRFQNTRIRLEKSGEEIKHRHYFSDLGCSLGRARGTFSGTSEKPNDFPWHFTSSGHSSFWRAGRSFQIVNYEPNEDTPAFAEITVDDAKWMARLLGQLSEEQLVAALVASGFSSAEVRIYTEKLLARRDRLIIDLDLENEIGLLRPEGPASRLSYDPQKDGRARVVTKDGQVVEAPAGKTYLKEGRIRTREGTD